MLSILDEKAITVIFANVEDILLVNTVRAMDSLHVATVFILTLQSDVFELVGGEAEGLSAVHR